MKKNELTFKIKGTAPLIMHNGQTADPLNPFSKRMKSLSSKRAKTESDFEEMAYTEFLAGLYVNNGKVVIPSLVIEAAIIGGQRRHALARLYRLGFTLTAMHRLNLPMQVKPPMNCGN